MGECLCHIHTSRDIIILYLQKSCKKFTAGLHMNLAMHILTFTGGVEKVRQS